MPIFGEYFCVQPLRFKIVYFMMWKNTSFKKAVLGLAGFFLQCTTEVGEPWPTALDLDRRRGCATMNEVNWAGSVSNLGVHDPDDDFIEIYNRDCNKPIDLKGWRFILRGAYYREFVVPGGQDTIVPVGGLAVVAKKTTGAFRPCNLAENPKCDPNFKIMVLPELFIPDRDWTIETKTAENFLIENEINQRRGPPFAGGFDGLVTRSMERTDNNFEEEGGSISSWFSFSPCNETSPSLQATKLLGVGCTATFPGASGRNVHPAYSLRTFASPGEINTPDYQ